MLTIKIKTDNAAFDGNLEEEIEECLRSSIDMFRAGYDDFNIHDTNGNVCGTFKLTNR